MNGRPTASGAMFKVINRLEHTTDAARCPQATKSISLPEPERLYCLAAVS